MTIKRQLEVIRDLPALARSVVVDVRAVVRSLTPGVPCDPRECDECGHITSWLTAAQLTTWAGSRWVPCSRRRCGGEMRRLDGQPEPSARTAGPVQ